MHNRVDVLLTRLEILDVLGYRPEPRYRIWLKRFETKYRITQSATEIERRLLEKVSYETEQKRIKGE